MESGAIIQDDDGRMAWAAMVQLLAYQRQLVAWPGRFTWSCWARQTGKSSTLSLRRILRGIQRRRTQLLVSAGMRQSRELMVKVRQHCHTLKIAVDSDGATAGAGGGSVEQIVLPSGVRVIALPARPETIRGFTGDVLLDEFAMHGDDRAIWAAIFPTILRSDGDLDIASTPKGKDNLFYQLGQNESFARTTLTLPGAISQGLDVDIEQLRKAMGDEELFRQEFLCEFLDESHAFLPYSLIARCEESGIEKDVNWTQLRQVQADLYVGVDVARKRDLTVIWLWERTAGARSDRRGAGNAGGPGTGDRAQPTTAKEEDWITAGPEAWSLRCAGVIELAAAPFGRQREMIRRVLETRCVRRCCIDATGMGLPLAEWAQEVFGQGRVEAVTFTAGLKAQMASQLRRLAEEDRLRIPAGEEGIRNDWHSVRRSTNAVGGLRLDAGHGESGHADRFWAAALGVHAADSAPVGPVEYTGAGQLRFARQGMW